MSRYTITVTSDGRSDPEAAIGYDPPLRTFFLQAFPDESGDDLALWLGTSDRENETVDALHAANAEPFDVKTVNWFIPDIDSPFYGGINTALRIADKLARDHGVRHRFVVWGSPPDHYGRSAITAADHRS